MLHLQGQTKNTGWKEPGKGKYTLSTKCIFKHDLRISNRALDLCNSHNYVSAQISNMNCQIYEMLWEENYKEKEFNPILHLIEPSAPMWHLEKYQIWHFNTNIEWNDSSVKFFLKKNT